MTLAEPADTDLATDAGLEAEMLAVGRRARADRLDGFGRAEARPSDRPQHLRRGDDRVHRPARRLDAGEPERFGRKRKRPALHELCAGGQRVTAVEQVEHDRRTEPRCRDPKTGVAKRIRDPAAHRSPPEDGETARRVDHPPHMWVKRIPSSCESNLT